MAKVLQKTIYVPSDLWKKMKEHAKRTGLKLQRVWQDAGAEYLSNHDGGQK